MKSRTVTLNDAERVVILIIDEVCTAQRVEYGNGTFIGETEEGKPAKTVLMFMVQSTKGKYKDAVALIPVNQLDTKLLHTWFNHVLHALNDILMVIGVSVDNHVYNRYNLSFDVRKMFLIYCNKCFF